MLIERFFPETSRLHRARERSQVATRALRMLGFTGPRGFLLGALLLIPSLLITIELNRLFRGTFGVRLPSVLVYAMACICVQVGWVIAIRRSVRRRVREELYELGVPVCTACGYDLTGNITGTCPECGQTPKLLLGGRRARGDKLFRPDLT